MMLDLSSYLIEMTFRDDVAIMFGSGHCISVETLPSTQDGLRDFESKGQDGHRTNDRFLSSKQESRALSSR